MLVNGISGGITGVLVTAVICGVFYGLIRSPSVRAAVAKAVFLLFICPLLIWVAFPTFGGGSDKPKLSSVKANMHAVQLGVEQYASDHHGDYPDGVLDSGFNWSSYVPSNLKNPYNQGIAGVSNMEPDVKLKPQKEDQELFYRAATYLLPGRPGTMRYISDVKSHSYYAIIGYDKNGNVIKESSASGSSNYVLHN